MAGPEPAGGLAPPARRRDADRSFGLAAADPRVPAARRAGGDRGPARLHGICLEDANQRSYLVHSLSGHLDEPVGGRVFSKEEGPDGGRDLDGVLARVGLRGALTVPLRRGIQTLGALLFACRTAPYPVDDLEVASLVAAGVSGALETCRAY